MEIFRGNLKDGVKKLSFEKTDLFLDIFSMMVGMIGEFFGRVNVFFVSLWMMNISIGNKYFIFI